MATPAPSEIENEFVRLSPEAQLTLLERLVHRTRMAMFGKRDTWEADLSAMAADPEMQRELNCINAEFATAEADVRVPTAESGLPMETVFLGFQFRSLDPRRFIAPPAGRISSTLLERVEPAVRHCLGL